MMKFMRNCDKSGKNKDKIGNKIMNLCQDRSKQKVMCFKFGIVLLDSKLLLIFSSQIFIFC